MGQAIKLAGNAGRVRHHVVCAEDRWRGRGSPDVVIEVRVELQIEPGEVRRPRQHDIRGGAALDAQDGQTGKLSQHHVVAAAALVTDHEWNAADVQGSSLRQTVEGIGHGIASVIVDDGESVADGGLESERGMERGIAQSNAASRLELIVAGAGRDAVQLPMHGALLDVSPGHRLRQRLHSQAQRARSVRLIVDGEALEASRPA